MDESKNKSGFGWFSSDDLPEGKENPWMVTDLQYFTSTGRCSRSGITDPVITLPKGELQESSLDSETYTLSFKIDGQKYAIPYPIQEQPCNWDIYKVD